MSRTQLWCQNPQLRSASPFLHRIPRSLRRLMCHPPTFSSSGECSPSAVISPAFITYPVLTYASEDDPYPRRSRSALSRVQSTSETSTDHSKIHEDLGGFPGPLDIIQSVLKRAAPTTYGRLERSMTIPSMTTLEEKKTPWLKFSGLVMGRNSHFRTDTLTAEQIEQIGGTEYRALEMLSWMVPAVCFGLFFQP